MNKIKVWFKDYLNSNKMQLTRYENLTPNNIILKEAKECKVKDLKLKYKRIPIETKYPNGKKGVIVIWDAICFEFGVNEKKSQETDKLVWYSISVCLWGRDYEPSQAERGFYDFICNFTEVCKQHLEEEYGADMASSMSTPLYYKKKEYVDKKGKRKQRQMSQPLQYFMLN